MLPSRRSPTLALVLVAWALQPLTAQTARVSETTRTLKTYRFSEPNPIPILTRDARLYPYHAFEGYAREGVPQVWRVVHLENDLIGKYVERLLGPRDDAGGVTWDLLAKSGFTR